MLPGEDRVSGLSPDMRGRWIFTRTDIAVDGRFDYTPFATGVFQQQYCVIVANSVPVQVRHVRRPDIRSTDGLTAKIVPNAHCVTMWRKYWR